MTTFYDCIGIVESIVKGNFKKYVKCLFSPQLSIVATNIVVILMVSCACVQETKRKEKNAR